MNEEAEIGRLRWRCRRGMKELDLLLGRWLDRCYAGASAEERLRFKDLLEQPDPLLAGYLIHGTSAAGTPFAGIVGQIRALLPR